MALLLITVATAASADGLDASFSTSGSSKSDGVNIVVHYPSSWTAKESSDSKTVERFKNSQDSENCELKIYRAPDDASMADLEKSTDALNTTLPSGGEFVGRGTSSLGLFQAITAEVRFQKSFLISTAFVHSISYTTLYNKHIISLFCGTHGAISATETEASFKVSRPVFDAIAAGLEFPDVKPDKADQQ